MALEEKLNAFEKELDKAAHVLSERAKAGELSQESTAMLHAGLTISRAIVLLARTNRQVRRA